MTREEVLKIFRQTGALLEGHFVLRGGRHSRQYVQCALALQQMTVVEKLGAALAAHVRHCPIQTVVAPAIGALVIGQEVARQLQTRFVFPEKESGNLVLRRGFVLKPGEKCLVVEDVITQGGRVQETLNIIQQAQAQTLAVAVMVDRSGGKIDFGVPLFALTQLDIETFASDQIPTDLKGIPAIKPGSQ